MLHTSKSVNTLAFSFYQDHTLQRAQASPRAYGARLRYRGVGHVSGVEGIYFSAQTMPLFLFVRGSFLQATLLDEAFRHGTVALLPKCCLARTQNCSRQPEPAVLMSTNRGQSGGGTGEDASAHAGAGILHRCTVRGKAWNVRGSRVSAAAK